MNLLIRGFLDNDSFFGRFMTKLGIIIAANLMFVVFSLSSPRSAMALRY